ncbi:Antirestriction protein [Methylophilus rhizosphaerae]|uniref:Antirestriction protein n=1 Tax=Methylophilus rhizosphaerae TaxID=492660 RepID=A0A1G9CP90_9PROT|nr:antirestriction protein [Methylophilus rhizosphaerae]SDK53482.1 Antirestriction protein [Methylophilus rhizosphaerae]
MTKITAALVPETLRITIPAQHFKQHFPFKIEPAIYNIARMLCPGYQGAYWDFYTLSNNGFFMVPDIDEPVRIVCENGYEGQVSKEAFGIIVCLYAYSHLSFTKIFALAAMSSEHFHALRDFALQHAEAEAILESVD